MNFRQLLRQWRRYRTPVLGLCATVLLVCSTVSIFDVPATEVVGFLLVCVVGVAIIMLSAFALSWILQKLRS